METKTVYGVSILGQVFKEADQLAAQTKAKEVKLNNPSFMDEIKAVRGIDHGTHIVWSVR